MRRSPLRRSLLRRSPLRRSPLRRSLLRRSPLRRSPLRRSLLRRSPLRRSPLRRSLFIGGATTEPTTTEFVKIKINQNDISTIIFVKDNIFDKNTIFTNPNINKSIIEFVKWEDPYTMVKYVFPGETSSTLAWGTTNRPFKICPIKYDYLLEKSNMAEYNICVFDKEKKLIGICVILKNIKYDMYWLEIMCTNIKNGIGGYLMTLILDLLNNYQIRLKAEVSVVPFYEKYGFKKIISLKTGYYGMSYNPKDFDTP
jgi:hypothetical protein